jgi:hypothetical protein
LGVYWDQEGDRIRPVLLKDKEPGRYPITPLTVSPDGQWVKSLWVYDVRSQEDPWATEYGKTEFLAFIPLPDQGEAEQQPGIPPYLTAGPVIGYGQGDFLEHKDWGTCYAAAADYSGQWLWVYPLDPWGKAGGE